MKKTTIIVLMLFISALGKATINKSVNIAIPGTLSSVLTANEKSTITNLTVTGTLDARDYKTMRDSMTNLKYIDLSNSTVSGYTGDNGTAGSSQTYPANLIPYEAYWSTTFNTVKLPSLITEIEHNTFYMGEINSVTIPSTVTKIGYSAFMNCIGLTDIILPSSLTQIDDAAFQNCESLQSIIIPPSVTTLGPAIFGYCGQLRNITLHFYD